jgi:outer membrane protein OmpA-like peptidoglycan-associated protein
MPLLGGMKTNTLAFLLTIASSATAAAAPNTAPDFHGRTPAADARHAVSRDGSVVLPVDVVYFGFDSTHVDRVSKLQLRTAARWIARHPGYRLVVEGHADRSGGEVYNAGLSDRRAKVVRERILAAGAPHERVLAVVFGENKPTGGPASNDRRVVVYATTMTRAEIIASQLPRGYAILWA